MFTRAWNIARWPVVMLLALLGIRLVYHVAPAVRQRWHWVTPGCAFALLGWLVASLALLIGAEIGSF